MASTLRLPDDLDEKLSDYCTRVRATKNRVCVIALRQYLDDGAAPRVDPDGPRERDGPLAAERLGATRLVRQLADISLDNDQIAAAREQKSRCFQRLLKAAGQGFEPQLPDRE